MSETLYAVNVKKTEDGKKVATLVYTITKLDSGYRYMPYNLEEDSLPRIGQEVYTVTLPAIAKRRLYSEKRPDIKSILSSLGMSEYDAWELLKLTKGIIHTDSVMFLSAEEYANVDKFLSLVRVFDEFAVAAGRG